MKGVLKEHACINLEIVDSGDLGSIREGTLFHGEVGQNQDPISKIRDFQRIIDSVGANGLDIAMLKLCFVDVGRRSNPGNLLESYASVLGELKRGHPKTSFIHCTVPIEAIPVDGRGKVKEAAKRLLTGGGVVVDNYAREHYNRLLRERYSARGSIFDIAGLEAVGPEGTVSRRRWKSEKVPVMDPRYSDDGGHLNEVGRRRMAEQLLLVLAGAAAARGKP